MSRCSLLTPSEDGLKYEYLEILPSRMPLLHLNAELDTHSASLLRVLMEAIHNRKELSPACQQVVDIYSDQINFEPCF